MHDPSSGKWTHWIQAPSSAVRNFPFRRHQAEKLNSFQLLTQRSGIEGQKRVDWTILENENWFKQFKGFKTKFESRCQFHFCWNTLCFFKCLKVISAPLFMQMHGLHVWWGAKQNALVNREIHLPRLTKGREISATTLLPSWAPTANIGINSLGTG